MRYFLLTMVLMAFSTLTLAQEGIHIVSRTPRYVTVEVPVCSKQHVVHTSHNRKILGAIAGGIIGNQVGGGNGRTIATALGAVLGSNAAKDHSYVKEETVCSYEKTQVQQGEIVTFSYNGKTFTQIFD